MSKVKPMQARLSWDEIREIEKKSKQVFPVHEDIVKLIRHIRFIEHLLESPKTSRTFKGSAVKLEGKKIGEIE